ncbi:MAG: ATP-binding cassette domain-containing protein [Chloroflexota bacterium]
MSAIQVDGLVRRFGDFTAVDGITFTVRENDIFGFLGPNGAGKTTTINMLCTLLRLTAGRAQVNGYDVSQRPAEVRRSIGLIFQDASLDEELTAYENLRFHAMLYDVPRQDFRGRSRELLEMVELSEKASDIVRTYSGGMKRRLEIARGLLHHPKVLFLDEPTLGLDPQTRRHIWDYLHKLRDQRGVTMFMTTHYMDEAEHCDRIAIIDNGQIVAIDTPENLKALVGGDVVTLRTSDDELASARLLEVHGIAARKGPEGQLIVETEGGDRFIPKVIETFSNGTRPVEVRSVNLRRPTLEDVFIKLTGHAIPEQEADPKDRMRQGRRMWGRGGRR